MVLPSPIGSRDRHPGSASGGARHETPTKTTPDPEVQRSIRETIKSCVRSQYPFTPNEKNILKIMLEDVLRYGRLPSSQHKMLLVFARKAGVQ